MQNKIVFVDLEETLVESWTNLLLCKKSKVEAFVEEHGNVVQLFSFAVWDDNDIKIFNDQIKPVCEAGHGLVFEKVWCCKDFLYAVKKYTGVHFELHEILSVWGKARTFEDFVLNLGLRDTEFVLLDDVVPNKVVTFQDTGNVIRYVKC